MTRKILFVSRTVPIPNTDGSSTYLQDLFTYLKKQGVSINYAFLGALPQHKFCWRIPAQLDDLVTISTSEYLRVGNLLFRKLVTKCLLKFQEVIGRCHSLRNKQKTIASKKEPRWLNLSKSEKRFVTECFKRFVPHVVVADYVWLAQVFDTLPKSSQILRVILTHDVLHQRSNDLRKAGLRAEEGTWTRDKEAYELGKADVLLAIQAEDAKTLKEMVPAAEVIHLPISMPCRPPVGRQVPGRCLFVGSSATHNVHGLAWFLKEVWPGVLRQRPLCTLHVCGTVCSRFGSQYPSVRFLGKIDDIDVEYGAAEVCIIPLFVGSGLKIKLVEALSHGRACVSTTFGIQGVRDAANKAVLVEDSPEGFASAVVGILSNPGKRKSMEREAHRFVREHFSPEQAYGPFVRRLREYLS